MERTIAISIRCLGARLTSLRGQHALLNTIDQLAHDGFTLSVPPLLGIEHIAQTIEPGLVVEVVGPWRVKLSSSVAATRWERARSLVRRRHLLGGFDEASQRVQALTSIWPDAVSVDVRTGDATEALVYHSTRDTLVDLVAETQQPLVVDLYHWGALLGEEWTRTYCGLLKPHNIASVHLNTRDPHDWQEFLAGRPSRMHTQLGCLRHVQEGTPVVVEVPKPLIWAALADLPNLRDRILSAMS